MSLTKLAVKDLTAEVLEAFVAGHEVERAASDCNLSAASLNALVAGLTAQTAQSNVKVIENIIRYSSLLRNMPETKTALTALIAPPAEEYKVEVYSILPTGPA